MITLHMPSLAFVVGAIALVLGFDAPLAQAQSWSYERFERRPGPHRWGERCMDRITTRGKAGIKLFSNKDKRQGMDRAVENWSQQVAAEFGPQFANWERSRGQELDCRTRKLKVICTASAHPCR
ncbi:MAG TPA: hypothetical protein VHI72_07855 [Hyphomicrobiaceae bacterium]|nr:hypothetical protein [Hyphomicrobiaceae bacterium]